MSIHPERLPVTTFRPRLGALLVAGGAGLVSSAPLAAQGTFEGMVSYTVEGMPGEVRYFQQGKKVRQEMQVEGMDGMAPVSIFDGATGTVIVLMPMQKQYMKMSAGAESDDATQAMLAQQASMAGDAPDFAVMKVKATGHRETVAGVACEHYVFESSAEAGGAKLEICGAPGMGFMGGGGPLGNPMSTAALVSLGGKSSPMAKLAKQGFFPLKMTMSVVGAPAMTWQVTKVEKKKLAASLFAIPAGYKEFKMPGMPQMSPPRPPSP